MLARLDLRGAGTDATALRSRLPRPDSAGSQPVAAVREILEAVRAGGDEALAELTERFDGAKPPSLRVAADEIRAAADAIPAPLRTALEVAWASIVEHHEHQAQPDTETKRAGLVVTELRRPMDRAGLYVPGGRARYPSTVLMTAGPARVAGVGELALTVPPGADGRIPVETLAAAAIAEVDEVYAVGGAQAIAALAYGTETIRAVDVIVGPGNVYVAIAKREVAGEGLVGVPSAFTGPSEVVVIADDSVPAEWAAVDVLVQAEHGPGGLAWLVTWDESVLDKVVSAGTRLLEDAPRRDDIESTLAAGGHAVLCDSPEQAVAVANVVAPEHLELLVADPDALVSLVRHAGAVFTGRLGTAAIGDYVAGPSHVLPTYGSARFSSALRVEDFQKVIHVIDLDDAAFARLAPHVVVLAEAEGLPEHARSVTLRGTRLRGEV